MAQEDKRLELRCVYLRAERKRNGYWQTKTSLARGGVLSRQCDDRTRNLCLMFPPPPPSVSNSPRIHMHHLLSTIIHTCLMSSKMVKTQKLKKKKHLSTFSVIEAVELFFFFLCFPVFSHAKFMVPEVYELLPVAISFHILNVQMGDSIFQQSCARACARLWCWFSLLTCKIRLGWWSSGSADREIWHLCTLSVRTILVWREHEDITQVSLAWLMGEEGGGYFSPPNGIHFSALRSKKCINPRFTLQIRLCCHRASWKSF